MKQNDCNIFKGLFIAVIISAPVWAYILVMIGAFK